VSSWGRYLDDLAAALTELLHEGGASSVAISDVPAVLAARDAVVVELRELVGAVADVPQYNAVRELTVADAVHRPAQALHQALSGLPRAVSFGDAERPAAADPPRRGYEHAWQRAARATLGLESYLGALGKLPDAHAWHVLRDLTDLAAAVPYLDLDLSMKILPALNNGEDLAVAYRMLTHSGHTAVRMVVAEIRARVPVGGVARSEGQPAALARNTSAARTPSGAAARSPGRTGATPGALSVPERPGQVADATARLTHAVSARGPNLSAPDLRAVARLLEAGSTAAATALDCVAAAVDGARETAAGLHTAASLARELRTVPVKAMTPPHLEVLRLATDLQNRMDALANAAARLRGAPSDSDLRHLAGPALEYAQHAPALAAGLELSVREAVAAKLMLVPGTVSWRPDLPVTWVTASMSGAARPGPPEIVERAGLLAASSRRIAPSARLATQDLTRQAAGPHPAQQAAAAARRRAGLARQELRAALSSRNAAGPAALAPDLPRHPALAPPLPGPGRCR
jgi:hypothetical protein